MIFFFCGCPVRIVEIPDQLDLGIVRFGSGIAKENFRNRHWRDLFEFLRKLDRRIVALARKEMRKGELSHLHGRCLDQLFVAVAKRRAPQPGHAFDIRLAFGVVDHDSLPALDDQRAGLAKA